MPTPASGYRAVLFPQRPELRQASAIDNQSPQCQEPVLRFDATRHANEKEMAENPMVNHAPISSKLVQSDIFHIPKRVIVRQVHILGKVRPLDAIRF